MLPFYMQLYRLGSPDYETQTLKR